MFEQAIDECGSEIENRPFLMSLIARVFCSEPHEAHIYGLDIWPSEFIYSLRDAANKCRSGNPNLSLLCDRFPFPDLIESCFRDVMQTIQNDPLVILSFRLQYLCEKRDTNNETRINKTRDSKFWMRMCGVVCLLARHLIPGTPYADGLFPETPVTPKKLSNALAQLHRTSTDRFESVRVNCDLILALFQSEISEPVLVAALQEAESLGLVFGVSYQNKKSYGLSIKSLRAFAPFHNAVTRSMFTESPLS